MASKNPRQFAIGVKFDVTVKENNVVVNISAATTMNYIIEKPDKTIATWAAAFITTGIDGKLRYITASVNDLDQIGRYKLQLQIIIPGGYNGFTEIGAFVVEENLE